MTHIKTQTNDQMRAEHDQLEKETADRNRNSVPPATGHRGGNLPSITKDQPPVTPGFSKQN
jgi:hypothetical protein